jgi:hypothetical protein
VRFGTLYEAAKEFVLCLRKKPLVRLRRWIKP